MVCLNIEASGRRFLDDPHRAVSPELYFLQPAAGGDGTPGETLSRHH
ncbi:MAG: hypothetical protein HPM95_16695 [Alphaproteobacteria bacterium]|nr:hypothetical protein [Alphaproteobacteria bacterium]